MSLPHSTDLRYPKPLIVIGASGPATLMNDAIDAAGRYGFVGFVAIGDPTLNDPNLKLVHAVDTVAHLGSLQIIGLNKDVVGFLVAIDDPVARLEAAAEMERLKFQPGLLVHRDATYGPNTDISPGCFLGPGARVEGGASVGRHTHIGSNAVVRSSVGEACTIGPNAVVLAPVGEIAVVDPGVRVSQRVPPFARVMMSPPRGPRQPRRSICKSVASSPWTMTVCSARSLRGKFRRRRLRLLKRRTRSETSARRRRPMCS